MPVHDWTRVDAGLFHAFHQRWISALSDALNLGILPPGYFALPEQNVRGPEGGEADIYAKKADNLTIRHRDEDVAVIEIVSPGNKGSRAELRSFVEKATELLRQNIHLLLIDLFPTSERDPEGMHKAIWDELEETDFCLPAEQRLTLVSYAAGPKYAAYVEPIAVGSSLPSMPLFLTSKTYVAVPLEETYQTTWSVFPAALKGLLE